MASPPKTQLEQPTDTPTPTNQLPPLKSPPVTTPTLHEPIIPLHAPWVYSPHTSHAGLITTNLSIQLYVGLSQQTTGQTNYVEKSRIDDGVRVDFWFARARISGGGERSVSSGNCSGAGEGFDCSGIFSEKWEAYTEISHSIVAGCKSALKLVRAQITFLFWEWLRV